MSWRPQSSTGYLFHQQKLSCSMKIQGHQCCRFQMLLHCQTGRHLHPTACSQSGSAGCAMGLRAAALQPGAGPTGSTSRDQFRHFSALTCCSTARRSPWRETPCPLRSKRCLASRCCHPSRLERREPREPS